MRNALTVRPLGILYARYALGAAFLSAVASRFGVWEGHVGLERFAGFMSYTGEVNSFMPAFTIPFLAWTATAAELSLGLALIFGIWPRVAALASAALLAIFGGHGDFVRSQIALGLFGVFSIGGFRAAGPQRI